MIHIQMLANNLQMLKRPSDQCQSLLELLHRLSTAGLHRFTEHQRCLCWRETTTKEDVHPVMREFNINTGYRHTGRSWGYYLRSGLKLHNETLNWLSHGVGCLAILALSIAWTLSLRPDSNQDDILMVWTFCATSVLLHAASSLAHLMHNRSELLHCCVFFIDNMAVGLSGFANNLLSVTFFSSASYYDWIAPATMPVLVFGSICLSAGFSLALAAYRRQYNLTTTLLMFGPSGCFMLFGLVPIVHRQIELGPDADMLGVPHYTVFLAGVLCYAVCFPERWCRGRFDLIGHSHQLFHTLVTCSHCMLLSAAFREINRDGPLVFSKRPGDWISVRTAYRGLAVSIVFSLAIVLLYVKAFQYDRRFKSKAARNRTD